MHDGIEPPIAIIVHDRSTNMDDPACLTAKKKLMNEVMPRRCQVLKLKKHGHHNVYMDSIALDLVCIKVHSIPWCLCALKIRVTAK